MIIIFDVSFVTQPNAINGKKMQEDKTEVIAYKIFNVLRLCIYTDIVCNKIVCLGRCTGIFIVELNWLR